jgi:DNA repair protein RadA/Sms
VGADSNEQKGLTTLGSKPGKSAEKRISTGNVGFDKVMSGGLLVGRVVLLGGFAGTGKTRMLLQIADFVAKTQGKVIYATGEESTDDIVSYANDMSLVNDRVIILGNQSCVEDVIKVADEQKVFLIIFDSAQEFMSNTVSGSAGSISQCKAIGTVIRDRVKDSMSCAIIVNQMTGEGTLKGGTELEHKCDTVNVLAYPKTEDANAPGFEEDGYRVLLNANKNRGGVANLKAYFRMNGEGILEHVEPASPLDDKGGKVVSMSETRKKYLKSKSAEVDQ